MIIFVHPNLSYRLCEEATKLHTNWLAVLKAGTPEEITEAQQAYFIHRNGTYRKNGSVMKYPCRLCGPWMLEERK